jgi:beta-N-acetylhexosaminidase
MRQAAGSLLVVGLGGAELSGLERAWLKLVRPAGIILFRRNIVDAAQTRALLSEASAFCSPQSFRCVDVEGGSVDRLRDALAPMPSAQAVARAEARKRDDRGLRTPTLSQKTRKDGAPGRDPRFPRSQNRDLGHPTELAYEHGELIAQAVRAFGFNTTLAPVLDLALPASAKVMGTRAPAATADGVIEYARGFLAGLAAHGVVGCGKHFPGLGGGTLDSHLETPSMRRSTRDLNREDLVPYRELRNELAMIMINHAAYPDTPSGNRPASASAYWITNVLRKRIGYRGIVFSDDLEMGGILKFLPIEEAVIAAVRAGMDLMEICHSPELILRAYESLLAESERSAPFRDILLARARKTSIRRKKLFAGKFSAAFSARQFEALRTRILRFNDKIAKAQPGAGTQPA